MADRRLKSTLSLDEPVGRVKGVSSARAKELQRLGIATIRDLLERFPRRYLDMSDVRTIADAQIGAVCTIRAMIHEIKLKRPKRNLSLVEISVKDHTGVLIATAFRQPWLMDRFSPGDIVALGGKVSFDYGFKRMTNPFIEELGSSAYDASGSVIPVHGASSKLSAAVMRRLVSNAIEAVRGAFDPLPLELRMKHRLESRMTSLSSIHFPRDMAEVERAKRRLKYEELLMLQLFLMREAQKRSAGIEPNIHDTSGKAVKALRASLPFSLTDEQQTAISDLFEEMGAAKVANHMLLGDVGTGKTVVASFGLAAAADSGGQSFLLAPTEVLAEQHARSIGAMLDSAGVSHALLTGSTDSVSRTRILHDLSEGVLQVLIGTHALLEDDVVPKNLTFVVIDEQQRFGVEQRERLLSKGSAPDALFLTATPIPRTLALALFGDIELSYIKKRPLEGSGRTTKAIRKKQRGQAYDAALETLKRGEQVYVVCPLIGVNSQERKERASIANALPDREMQETDYHPEVVIEDDADQSFDNSVAAIEEAAFLQRSVFPDYRVEVLHGGLPSTEKREKMEAFRRGEIDVLVATTVIEVGVDVANATCMIIEDADRFGLSQLHQLRGRVGRGDKPGKVFLVSASTQEAALKRLSALEHTEDGYKLAEYDLALRKEGDVLGNRQSGASSLKLVNVISDGAVIEAANEDARRILDSDPSLAAPEHRALKRELSMIFGKRNAHIGG